MYLSRECEQTHRHTKFLICQYFRFEMFFLYYLFEQLIDTVPLVFREASKRRQLRRQRNSHSEGLQDRFLLVIRFGSLADYCRGNILKYTQDKDNVSEHYQLNEAESVLWSDIGRNMSSLSFESMFLSDHPPYPYVTAT